MALKDFAVTPNDTTRDPPLRALRFGRPVSLDAMTASERKHVHEYLRERGDVETHSEGDEPDRRLVVSPTSA